MGGWIKKKKVDACRNEQNVYFGNLWIWGNFLESFFSPFTWQSFAPDTSVFLYKSMQVIVPWWPVKIRMQVPLLRSQYLRELGQKNVFQIFVGPKGSYGIVFL